MGQTTTGIEGKGAFSAKLGGRATISAAVIALATGVPITKLAQGGTYTVTRAISARGTITGTAVTHFKAHGLGTACVRYTETPGKYTPGAGFIPMSGTITSLGGTGAAAHWRVRVNFTQKSVSGLKTETFGGSGAEQIATGKARGMTAACKRVANVH